MWVFVSYVCVCVCAGSAVWPVLLPVLQRTTLNRKHRFLGLGAVQKFIKREISIAKLGAWPNFTPKNPKASHRAVLFLTNTPATNNRGNAPVGQQQKGHVASRAKNREILWATSTMLIKVFFCWRCVYSPYLAKGIFPIIVRDVQIKMIYQRHQ